MKSLMFALLVPLAGCLFLPSRTRTPAWTVDGSEERFEYDRAIGIPERHLIVAVTQARHLVAYDSRTGELRWHSDVHVPQINGFDQDHITIGPTVIDAATGKTVSQLESEKMGYFSGVSYGIVGARELVASAQGVKRWSDHPGFTTLAIPEMRRYLLVLRGMADHAPIGYIRVYEPATGRLVWDAEAEGGTRPYLDAQIAGDRAIVLREGVIESRELTTGRVVWTQRSDRAPLVSESRVVAFDQDKVLVLNAADGKSVASWKKPSIGLWTRISVTSNGIIYTSHAVPVNTLGGMRYDCSVYALDENSGAVRWQSSVDKRTDCSRPIVMDGYAVMVSPVKIYALKTDARP